MLLKHGEMAQTCLHPPLKASFCRLTSSSKDAERLSDSNDLALFHLEYWVP